MPKLQLSPTITVKQVAAATAMVCGLLLMGAIVTVEPPERLNGHDVYPVSLSLANVGSAAGIQFDVQMDPALNLAEVVAGPAADDAGKTVVFTRLDEDTLRVMVVGLNQNIIGDGVVAYLHAVPQDSPTDPFTVGATILSDQVGNPIEWSEADQPASDEPEPASENGSGNEPSPGTGLDVPADNKSVTAPAAGLMPALLDAVVGDYALSAAPPETETDPETAGKQSNAAVDYPADVGYMVQAGQSVSPGYLQARVPAQPARTRPQRGQSYRACNAGAVKNSEHGTQDAPTCTDQPSGSSKSIASAQANHVSVSGGGQVRAVVQPLQDDAAPQSQARTRIALLALAAALPALAAALWTLKTPLGMLLSKTATAATPVHRV